MALNAAFLVWGLAFLASCGDRGPGAILPWPSAPKKTIETEDGHCRQFDIPKWSLCYLVGVDKLWCGDCKSGEVLYALGYRAGKGPNAPGFRLARFRIPAGRAVEFEYFAVKKSPARCAGTIITPPCNPDATNMSVEVDFPAWVRFVPL